MRPDAFEWQQRLEDGVRESSRYLRHSRRPRWRRWLEGLDPWSPRPVDYVVAAGIFLGLALAYVGERSYAVELNRRIFRLQERAGSLTDANDLLATRVTSLADRARVVTVAQRDLGMIVPGPEAFGTIYYVPEGRGARRQRWILPPATAGVIRAPLSRSHGR